MPVRGGRAADALNVLGQALEGFSQMPEIAEARAMLAAKPTTIIGQARIAALSIRRAY
jgi:hypothetical protein